jgi:hypothetical protein
MKSLPKLPRTAFSLLGPVKVSLFSKKKADKLGACGLYDYCARIIKIRPGMNRTSEWVTLWHESVHIALMDAGVHGNTLTKEQEEAVCDAVGTYLTAMMQAGRLVTRP